MMPHLPRSAAVRLPAVLAVHGARVPAGPDDLRAMCGLAASISASAVFWALVLTALRTF